jgi:NADPH:quinone reductase-like Zn-dependent oxidoreductase
MAASKTYKAFRRTTGDLPRSIQPSTEPYPRNLSPTAVLLKIHAVSLNFRDVGMLNGRYPVEVLDKGIPTSDCAAEVVEIGSNVKRVKVGDHVAPIFNLTLINGDEDEKAVALGGDVDGPLSEYAVFDEKVLVKLPDYLSWEEVSTILSRRYTTVGDAKK